MSISIGGMSLLSLRTPYSELVGTVFAKADLRSLFCLVVLVIIVLVLAYLTNPSENSFRAYLTEQSFRQHLSRLDDHVEDDLKSHHDSRTPQRSHAPTPYFDHSTAFHFANRASVSLKTPKHVFHSFGIFTIAAMLPLAKSARTDDRDAQIISESWYFGAFGHWWRGGIIEAWYQDVIARSKDEEGWSSGILSIKNLDMLNDCTGLPFTTKNLPPHLLSRGSPPRLRNRERPSQKQPLPPARSSSPPPLPKSASLPLHTPKHSPGSSLDRLHLTPAQPVVQNQTSDQPTLGASLPSVPPSTLFDQSPRIAEVLRQINQSKSQLVELRGQYNECQASAQQSHTLLQTDVDSLRERKRQEEASKLESKARTKTLDDSKRAAEALKRDAERKLKVAQNARDNATQRIGNLDKEISKLHQRLTDDQESMKESEQEISEAEQELIEALERKRQELKIAEDVVTALNHRARELEEQVSAEREHLAAAKERQQQLRQFPDAPGSPTHISAQPESPSYIVPNPFDLTNRAQDTDVRPRTRSLNGMDPFSILNRRLSLSRDNQADINAFGPNTHTRQGLSSSTGSAPLRTGYPSYDEDSFGVMRPQATTYQNTTTTFSPFADLDRDFGVRSIISPTSQSLVPSALIASLDSSEGLPRSFQSESDAYLDKEWRNASSYAPIGNGVHDYQDQSFSPLSTSPVSIHSSVFTDSTDSRHYMTSDNPMSMQRVSIHRTNSDPRSNHVHPDEEFGQLVAEKTGPRRWFSTNSKEKSKKGLNPDAKVFSLSRKSPSTGYDALNPNGLSTHSIPSTATSTNLFSRAFAPSPAEREVLQRAFAGSANTSLERLPSLSEVGSMPSSPTHSHATPVLPPHGGRDMSKVLPSWLQSFSMSRKPATTFSPWDDEDEAAAPGGAGYR